MAIAQCQLSMGATARVALALCQHHLIGNLLLDARVDLVEPHVGVYHHEEVAIAGTQRPGPTRGSQQFRRLGIIHVNQDVLLVQAAHDDREQPAQFHILPALQLALHGLQQETHEVLAVLEPLPPFLAIVLSLSSQLRRVLRCSPGRRHELQHVLPRHGLVEPLQAQRLQRLHQPLHRRQIGGDHTVYHHLLVQRIEAGHHLGSSGEIGRPVGIPQHQDLSLHVLQQRRWRRRMRLAEVIHGVAVLKAQFHDAALVQAQQTHATDEAAGGTQFVIVLSDDEVGARLIGAQQVRRQASRLHRQAQQRQVAIQPLHQLPHTGREAGNIHLSAGGGDLFQLLLRFGQPRLRLHQRRQHSLQQAVRRVGWRFLPGQHYRLQPLQRQVPSLGDAAGHLNQRGRGLDVAAVLGHPAQVAGQRQEQADLHLDGGEIIRQGGEISRQCGEVGGLQIAQRFGLGPGLQARQRGPQRIQVPPQSQRLAPGPETQRQQ